MLGEVAYTFSLILRLCVTDMQGTYLAHQRHGVLPWETLVQPAINLATNGFPAPAYLVQVLLSSFSAITKYPLLAGEALAGLAHLYFLQRMPASTQSIMQHCVLVNVAGRKPLLAHTFSENKLSEHLCTWFWHALCILARHPCQASLSSMLVGCPGTGRRAMGFVSPYREVNNVLHLMHVFKRLQPWSTTSPSGPPEHTHLFI